MSTATVIPWPFNRRHHKPKNIHITPRRMDFPFSSVERYWFGGDPVMTHFLNALSLTFPDGERFFVDSVRAFRDQITDPELQQEISGFIGQEAMHSLEHQSFNELLMQMGYEKEAQSGIKFAQQMLARGRKFLSPKQQLAATTALEHITAILAHRLLSNPKWTKKMRPEVRVLWLWHAIEEIEHKAVAFDVFEQVGGSYKMRTRLLFYATLYLAAYTGRYTWVLIKKDKAYRRPLAIAKGLWSLLGPFGFVTTTLPSYLSFYRPGFHPWQQDNSALIAAAKQELEQLNHRWQPHD